jgi:hypothetical protein
MYKRNNEARSINHSCSGKAVTVTNSECLFVALFIEHAIRMRRVNVVICGLRGSTVFLHITS